MIKNIKSTVLVLLVIITFTSCGQLRDGINANKSVDLSVLKLGMSKGEVQKQLRKRPDNIVATKKDPETNTLVQVVQYTDGGHDKSYWLYFVDDKLDKWETASRLHEPWI